jgi:hypothetical protein
MRTVKPDRHKEFALAHSMSSHFVSAKTGESVSKPGGGEGGRGHHSASFVADCFRHYVLKILPKPQQQQQQPQQGRAAWLENVR